MSRKNKKHQVAKEAQEELTDEQLDDLSGGGSGELNTFSTPTSDGAVPIPYPSVPTTSTQKDATATSGDDSGSGSDTTSGTGTAGGTIDFVGKAITP